MRTIKILIFLLLVSCNSFATQTILNYDISVSINPNSKSLSSTSIITFDGNVPEKLQFRLLNSLKITSLSAIGFEVEQKKYDDNYTEFNFIKLDDANKFRLVFNFKGEVFNLPRETNLIQRHSNSLGIISPNNNEGIYLPAGSFYPYNTNNLLANFAVQVEIEKGYSVILSGNKLDEIEEERNITTWKTPFPVDEITLVGGKYVKYQKEYDSHKFNIFTYDSTKLADRYLDAVIEHYKIYTDLFGDYPFNEFSIVENFFATGFGMPGYTLLSGKLLAMPYVTLSPGSLAHEFVHNWWGNSVYVDYEKGNWCEALTTFCSNYYYNVYKGNTKEELEWYKKALIAIDDLPAERNYPVIKFQYQRDMLDAVVGYSKGAFIFYEIYKLIGKEHFFAVLKDLAKIYRGKRAYWEDLINLFDKHTPDALKKEYNIKKIINNWLNSTEIPEISIIKTKINKNNLELTIKKTTDLIVTTEISINRNGNWESKLVTLKNNTNLIQIPEASNISEIVLDKNYRSLRKVFEWEKTFTFSKILSSKPLIVVPEKDSPNREVAEKFYQEMLESGYECSLVESDKITEKQIQSNSIIALGTLDDNKVIKLIANKIPDSLQVKTDEIHFPNGTIKINEIILMANTEHPTNSKKYAGAIIFDNLQNFDPLKRLFHYQSYSLALLDLKKPGRPIYSLEIYPNIKNKQQQIVSIKK